MGILSLLIVCSLCLSGHAEEGGKHKNGITFQRYRKRHSRLMQDIRDLENEPPNAGDDLPEFFKDSAHQIQGLYDRVSLDIRVMKEALVLQMLLVITCHSSFFFLIS